jgi:UDP-N-acetylglucosamine diphosphorylase / glucose-1-phosphate thymidylyltransferase / UDP-N-acetylgalactosamine diphosphorylase / glucosamine-1-phosphate N-acetyltransferase / galactosamine-1-phosphate N-acetyltransferase
MIKISDYISRALSSISSLEPWNACDQASSIISSLLLQLPDEYVIKNGNAVHKTATIEVGAVLKAPCIIGPNSFVASYAYLREGVWLDSNVIIGPSCEIKSSFIFSGSKIAHFNYVGNSIIGRNINIEAGAIIANYRNELDDKEAMCIINGKKIKTSIKKFGALIGDGCRIGANAVLAPSTILEPKTIVNRLALIDQSLRK